MAERTLTITLDGDWQAALRREAKQAFRAEGYQGESLNFDSPAVFFGRLTQRRWDLLRILQGAGALGIRELARRVGRDVERVHQDVAVLAEVGLVERTERDKVLCPFSDIHVDMHLRHAV